MHETCMNEFSWNTHAWDVRHPLGMYAVCGVSKSDTEDDNEVGPLCDVRFPHISAIIYQGLFSTLSVRTLVCG